MIRAVIRPAFALSASAVLALLVLTAAAARWMAERIDRVFRR